MSSSAASLIRRLSNRIVREVKQVLDPAHRRWLKKKKAVDRDFDAVHGVDTGGLTPLGGLGITAENWREGVRHIAVDPDEFASAIAAVNVDLSNFTFIDLGSGKGRALMLASHYPFQRLIGVEFAEPLVAIARSNLRGSNAEIFLGDATKYDLPIEPTVLFLYNPFGRSVMDVVARRARESLRESPRDFIIVYLNPFHLDSWLKAGFEEVFAGPHFVVIKKA